MRRLVEETTGEGLQKLMGQRVTLFCGNYIYTGKLVGVDESCVLLTDPAVVYETGPFTEPSWKDAQPLPGPWYITTRWIESFGVLK